jgi:hypothetical protein
LPVRFGLHLTCAAVLTCAAAYVFDAQAQGVVRVKARLTAFDGQVMTLEPLAATVAGPAGAPLSVALLPRTQIVQQQKSFFGALKPGDYAGAAVTLGRGGWLRAQNVYLYADALRGSGEGRFEEGGRLLVNGAVREAKPTSAQDMFGGTIILHYRGATLTGAGKNAVCEGRAVPQAYASALACSADAAIEVLSGTPVSTLTLGDRSLLVPGATLSVALSRQPDGSQVAPGLIVEMPQSSP